MRSLATNGSWALRWVFFWSVLWFGRDYLGQKQPPYCLRFDLRYSFSQVNMIFSHKLFPAKIYFCHSKSVFSSDWISGILLLLDFTRVDTRLTYFFSWVIWCSATNYFPLTFTFVIQSLCSVLIEISGISLLLLLFMSLLLVLLKTVEFCCS